MTDDFRFSLIIIILVSLVYPCVDRGSRNFQEIVLPVSFIPGVSSVARVPGVACVARGVARGAPAAVVARRRAAVVATIVASGK